MKFSISITQQYRTKLRAIALNADCFKRLILNFKTFIYNNVSKIIHNFFMYGGNTVSRREEVDPLGKKFVNIGIF